jgi:hypothetical protein
LNASRMEAETSGDRMATRAARVKRSDKGSNKDQSGSWDVQLTGPVQVEGTD